MSGPYDDDPCFDCDDFDTDECEDCDDQVFAKPEEA